jgi:hypothetical protein
MKVKFLQSGESPEFGPFKEGEEKDLDKATAQLLKDRGVVDIVVDPVVKSAIRNPKSAIEREG